MSNTVHIATMDTLRAWMEYGYTGSNLPGTLCGCATSTEVLDSRYLQKGMTFMEVLNRAITASYFHTGGDLWLAAHNSDLARPNCPACLLVSHTNPELVPRLSSLDLKELGAWPK